MNGHSDATVSRRFWAAYALLTLPVLGLIWWAGPDAPLWLWTLLGVSVVAAALIGTLARLVYGWQRWAQRFSGLRTHIAGPQLLAVALAVAVFAFVLFFRAFWAAPDRGLGGVPYLMLQIYGFWLPALGWLGVFWAVLWLAQRRTFRLFGVFAIAGLLPAWVGAWSAAYVQRELSARYDQQPFDAAAYTGQLERAYRSPQISIEPWEGRRRLDVRAEDSLITFENGLLDVYTRWNRLIEQTRFVLQRKDTDAFYIELTHNGQTLLRYTEEEAATPPRPLRQAQINRALLPQGGRLSPDALQRFAERALDWEIRSARMSPPQAEASVSTEIEQNVAQLRFRVAGSTTEPAIRATAAAYAVANRLAAGLYRDAPELDGVTVHVESAYNKLKPLSLSFADPPMHPDEPVTAALAGADLRHLCVFESPVRERPVPERLIPSRTPGPAARLRWVEPTGFEPYVESDYLRLWSTYQFDRSKAVLLSATSDCTITLALWQDDLFAGVHTLSPGTRRDAGGQTLAHHGVFDRESGALPGWRRRVHN